VLCIFKSAKISRIHDTCQNMNMIMMKMLNYQFIYYLTLPKSLLNFMNFLKKFKFVKH